MNIAVTIVFIELYSFINNYITAKAELFFKHKVNIAVNMPIYRI